MRQPLAILGVVLVLIGATGFIVKVIRENARYETIEKIRDATEAALEKAEGARKTVDDCYKAGGVWDRSAGKCLTP